MSTIFKIPALLVIGVLISSAGTQKKNDVILWMEKQDGKVIYRSESEIILESKLLDFFAEINDKFGTDRTIFVLFQNNIGLSEIEGIEMDIQKVADFKIRFFYFSKEFAKAKEILFTDNLVELSTFKR